MIKSGFRGFLIFDKKLKEANGALLDHLASLLRYSTSL